MNVATLVVPLLVCVVGLVAWALTANAKVSEAGRIAYFVGLFWLVAILAHVTIRF